MKPSTVHTLGAGAALAGLVALLAIAGIGVGTPPAPAASAPRTLVVAGYGGEYKDIFWNTVGRPFEQQFNVKITFDEGGSADQNYAKIRATQGDPGWDVLIATSYEAALGAREGLLRKITAADVPNLAFVYPEVRRYVGDFGAAEEIQQMLLVYNTKYIHEPPQSWAALWDPKYRGRVLVFDPASIMGIYSLIMAARLDGGSETNLEPGFKRYERLRPQLRAFLVASTAAIPLFEQGEVWIMPYWDGRTTYYISKGLPMKAVIPKEGTVGLVNALLIPKGARNPGAAYEFINYWLSQRVQNAWALAYTVGPARPGATLPADFAALHITSLTALKRDILPDLGLIIRERPQWSQRIKEIMAR
jgi:putative spermidine/putrescine transport system substrate-binding protein